jgi:CspA family cold shock protein
MTDRDAIGTVGFFNDRGGYGFSETEDSNEDMFFHMEGISGPDLTDGTRVEFDIEQADKGPSATNVVRGSFESRSYESVSESELSDFGGSDDADKADNTVVFVPDGTRDPYADDGATPTVCPAVARTIESALPN